MSSNNMIIRYLCGCTSVKKCSYHTEGCTLSCNKDHRIGRYNEVIYSIEVSHSKEEIQTMLQDLCLEERTKKVGDRSDMLINETKASL